MPVRKIGRCRITVEGRDFVWWIHNEGESLRVASDDKKFVVEYQLAHPIDAAPLLKISGSEFSGVARNEKRPVYVLPPKFEHYYSFKGLARRVIQWSLREDHVLVRMPREDWILKREVVKNKTAT
ncbi:MAG TPA: hypothetical protein VG269_10970 [Tepidisphaeraceae bacterium]|jgi:hypothetical protein|nr:hypothetical protein [Tepidisphaeraceae bacterium]